MRVGAGVSPEAWEELWNELANEVTRRASALAESVDAAASNTRHEREQAFALSRDMRLVAMLHGAVSADRGAELIERARRLLGRPPCAVDRRVEDDDEDETTIPRRVNHLLEHESAEGAARSARPVRVPSPPPPVPGPQVMTKRDAAGLRLNWSDAGGRKNRW